MSPLPEGFACVIQRVVAEPATVVTLVGNSDSKWTTT